MSLGALLRNGKEIMHALYVSAEFMQKEENPVFHLQHPQNHMNAYGICALLSIV